MITGTDPERGEQVAADLAAGPGSARFVAADLVLLDDIRRLADEAGAVDIVNNGSLITVGATAEQDVESYDAAFAVNVRAPYLLAAHFAPLMAANGGGSIINIRARRRPSAWPACRSTAQRRRR